MVANGPGRRRRLVVAPPVATLSAVLAVVLAVVGGWLLATAGGPAVVSIGVALWWLALNVLVVGLVSASAWHRRRPVVGGEKVPSTVVARAHPLRGRLHAVSLESPDGTAARVLHGFVSLRAADAERLATRLTELVGAVSASDPGPVPVLAEVGAVPGAEPTDADTVSLRRALPLVGADPGTHAPPPEDPGTPLGSPRHGGGDDPVSDPGPVLPRRARRD
ncbi:MAG TPA: hypothetical protein VFN73_07370 [Propionibacteriaceae bacterium]|nr:hypothetical protein [Propionibacteriaceae bacterium]